jgi:hypothetical protein
LYSIEIQYASVSVCHEPFVEITMNLDVECPSYRFELSLTDLGHGAWIKPEDGNFVSSGSKSSIWASCRVSLVMRQPNLNPTKEAALWFKQGR